ncbi:MAG TPA: HEAT repeat domain-containing protein [Ktedonobacterales bacterium]|nr:HEAT repeat domain-containing protein [Ktedonobacterales bacterium]
MRSHDEPGDQPTPRLAQHDGDGWANELPVLPGSGDDTHVPTPLLAGVMARVARLDAYLAPDATETTLLAATHAPEWEARATASYALGAYATGEAGAALASALHDDDVTTRVAAVYALCRQPTRLPLDQLIVALRDPAWDVREAVALALGQATKVSPEFAHDARPLLLATLGDAHPTVRMAAQQALDALDGRSALVAPAGARGHVAAPSHASAPATPATQPARAPQARPAPISTSQRGAPSWLGDATSALRHFGQTLIRQPTLIQRGWMIPALAVLASELAVLFIAQRITGDLHDMSVLLEIVTALSAAIGVAFAANMAHDPVAELALATPTSPRVILLARYCAVLGATFLLSGCASAVEAALYGQSLWAVVQLWLGPTLLLASLTLALVMVVGSWLAALAACLLEIVQVARIGPGGALLPLAQPHLWMTSPLVLGLAALCLALALLYAPRQPRLFASFGDR